MADRSPRRHTPLGTPRKARSQFDPGIGRGKAGHGRADQAFVLVESRVVTGPRPIPCRGPPQATNRMTRPPRRSPPREAARGFWIRAWRPARGRSSRNLPLERASTMRQACSRVGWTIPATHAKTTSLRDRTLLLSVQVLVGLPSAFSIQGVAHCLPQASQYVLVTDRFGVALSSPADCTMAREKKSELHDDAAASSGFSTG